jgi:predicted MFS family arabinose efflux permease
MSTSARSSDWAGIALGLALASFAAYQMFKLPPVLPLLLEQYGYPRALAGGFMSAYAVAGLLLSIPLGRTLERFGFLAPLLGACGLFVLANLLGLALPESGWAVLAARGLEGISFALCAVAGPSLATRNAGPRHAGLVIGLVAAWIPLGQIAAALLAHGLTPVPGWPALWWIAIAGSLGLAGWAVLRRGRLPGPATAASRAADPRLSGAQVRGLALAGGIFMLWSGQYFAFMTWLPQYLVEAAGLSLQGALLGYLLPVLVLLALNIVTGWLLGRGVSHAGLLLGALLSQAACWWAMPHAGSGLLGIALLAVYGAGAGIAPTCLFAVPGRLTGGRPVPSAFSILMTGRNLGVLAGPVLIALVVERAGGDWAVAAPIFGSLTLVAAVFGLILAPRLRG